MNLISIARPSPRTIMTVVTTVVVALLAIAGLTMVRQPAAAAPDLHTIELRVDGDGVAQYARVWDGAGQHDVETWAGPRNVTGPRAAFLIAQAGVNQSASCVILLDGTEVARELAQPFATVTCAWVR